MFKSSSSLFSALAANVTAPIIGKENVLELRKFYQPFGYHLVQPSPWPILVSFSLLAVTLGLTMYMHGYLHNSIQIILALSLTTFGISLWLRDVILEATFLGDHTKEVTDNIVMGIVLFIVSEVFVFLSVFWAAFHSALSPSIEQTIDSVLAITLQIVTIKRTLSAKNKSGCTSSEVVV